MGKENRVHILPFSAKSSAALENTVHKVMVYLKENQYIDITDAAWTLQKGRRNLEYREAIVASRKDIEDETYNVWDNNGNIENIKQNLVIVLPGVQDVKTVWKPFGLESEMYKLTNSYDQTVLEMLELMPSTIAELIKNDENTNDLKVNCFKAFISGYALTKVLLSTGIQPTALVGERIAELSAMASANAIDVREAIELINQYGEVDTYENLYTHLRKKQIPVIRKPGKKAKQHIDEAIVIKLGSRTLENSITKRCMVDVNQEDILCLISNESDKWLYNLYNLIAKLWCKGIKINWSTLNSDVDAKRVILPTYVFDKKKFDSDVVFGNYTNKIETKEISTKQANPSEVLQDLWKEALGLSEVKKEDDFFDKGGCSLSAIMLSAKIKEILKVDFPLSEMFNYPTFGKMEKYIKAHISENVEDVIQKLGKQDYYEASSAQKRMYAVNEMIEDAIPYNFAAVYKVKGIIDAEKLQNCFTQLVARHEAFRTRFDLVDGEVVQIVEDHVDFKVNFENATIDNLNEKIEKNIKPFDLSKAPLLRVALISISEEEHVMILDMHHIIADQSSLAILINEIGLIYKGEELPSLDIQYKDFAKWQNDFFKSSSLKKQLDYWKKEFEQGIPVLELYTDYDRSDLMKYKGEVIGFEFEDELNKKIISFAKDKGITPYMLIMAALNIMLWKYTNQKEIVIGTAIAGRRHAKLESIIGMFVNTLAIKSEINQESNVNEYLQYTKNKMVSAYDNQDCQFDMLVEELNIPKSTSRNPLFDVVFNYINIGTDEVALEGIELAPYENKEIDVKFDLTFTLEENNQKFNMDIEYATALYKEETVQLMGKRLIHVISQIIDGEDKNLQEITLMTEEERCWLLKTVNQTTTDYAAHKTVLSVFEECVQKTPNAVAVEWLDDEITYKQLNNMANQLAEKLANRDIHYQSNVSILLDRGYMQIVCMLAIMKLGAVYIPIDPKYPQERIDYVLEDSEAVLIITEEKFKSSITKEINKLVIDDDENSLDRLYDMTVKCPYTPLEFNGEDIIYIIYTSGSTGKPKGTLLKHKNVMRVVKNTNYIEIEHNDRIMQLSNYAFDGSVFGIYGALLNSATVVIVPRETALEIPMLADFIEQKKITVFFITTALFHMLVDWKVEALVNVRKLLVGGEQLFSAYAQKALNTVGQGKLVNVYGPTESAVFATYYPMNEIEEASNIPIGRPIANTTAYIVDENMQLAPINVPGELCLGGDGLGEGYLKREDLTNEKFIQLEAAGNQRVYRTGDRVVWNSNGEIVFLGRIDFQVKIRGYRVELGEVERYIEAIKGVRSSIVVAQKDNLGVVYMVAYYTINDYGQRSKYSEEHIREILSSNLPEYMVPTQYMLLEELPLNINGKIDRNKLPQVKAVESKKTEKDMPKTITEHKILESMKKILDNPDFGVKDDFFVYGGQSIKTIALVKELLKQGIELRVNEVFQYKTAERIARAIEKVDEVDIQETKELNINLEDKQIQSIVQYIATSVEGINTISKSCDIKKKFNLSQIQKGHLEKGSNHSGFTLCIEGAFTEKKIKDAVGNVICNNQLLHSKLIQYEEKYMWGEYEVQNMLHVISNYLTYTDVSMYSENCKHQMIRQFYDAIMFKPYNVDELLWRMCIVKENANKHLIICSCDHLIFDGMSSEIMKHQIENELGQYVVKEMEATKNYEEYVSLLEQGPSDITPEEIVQIFQLDNWCENNNKIMSMQKQGESKKLELIIPMENIQEADIWKFAFDVVCDILRGYTHLEDIPFAIIDYGRSYRGQDFYNSIGEFLDIIPILSISKKTNNIEDVLKTCKEHAINFLTLIGQEKIKTAYANVYELIGQSYNRKDLFGFILYNFQGFVMQEEKKAFESNAEENDLAEMSVVVNYDQENIYIEWQDRLGLEEEISKYLRGKDKWRMEM